ncbi:MAG: hypothetical protein HC859_05590 [Bacteroidia bacterium]|nr:hypothetical protein [Bacteroidia bacterium]
MSKISRWLKLNDTLSMKLALQPEQFRSRLNQIVDADSPVLIFGAFEALSSGAEYRGEVLHSTFKLRRRVRMFDTLWSLARVRGTYHRRDDSTHVDAEITGFHGMIVFLSLVLIAIYLTMISTFLFGDPVNELGFVIFPLLLIHASFYVGYSIFNSPSIGKAHEV